MPKQRSDRYAGGLSSADDDRCQSEYAPTVFTHQLGSGDRFRLHNAVESQKKLEFMDSMMPELCLGYHVVTTGDRGIFVF